MTNQIDLLEQAGQNNMCEFIRASNRPPNPIDELAMRRLFNEGREIAKELQELLPDLEIEFFS